MISTLKDILINLVAALIGAVISYLAVFARRKFKQRALHQAVRAFFGLPGKVLIVHSAVFDTPEQAYNYPATDTRAARALAKLFESVGLRDGIDFAIHPDRRVPINDSLWNQNLVLLCGPARNAVFRHVAPTLSTTRYSMTVGADDTNVLMDHRREQRLRSSRESGSSTIQDCFDWGLMASLPNPRNMARRVVLLAGIHGTGTVGAAEFVSNLDNLKILVGRKKVGMVSEVVRVDYDGDIETPTGIELV